MQFVPLKKLDNYSLASDNKNIYSSGGRGDLRYSFKDNLRQSHPGFESQRQKKFFSVTNKSNRTEQKD